MCSSYCKHAPPTVNTAPPTINSAPPTVNTAPPTVNWAPPIVNTAPPTVSWAPPTENDYKRRSLFSLFIRYFFVLFFIRILILHYQYNYFVKPG